MKKLTIIFLILTIAISCTKTIDFDDEGYANQIVINSTISNNSYFKAYTSKSTSILTNDHSSSPVEASMDLYEDGTLIRQFPTQLGGFSATDIIPKAGKTYRMVITSEGKKMEAETVLPNKVDVISVDTASVESYNNSRSILIKMKIKDTEGDDYYRIVYLLETISYQMDSKGARRYYRSFNQSGIASDDPVFKSVYNNFGDEIIDGPGNDYNIFPDTYFNGKEYAVRFRTTPGFYGNTSFGYGGTKIYERNEIHIQKLSKDFYNYLKYLKLYRFYHNNPFAEPVPIYSNIKNGIGVFAGYNDEVKLEYEKKFIPFSMDTIKLEQGSYGY